MAWKVCVTWSFYFMDLCSSFEKCSRGTKSVATPKQRHIRAPLWLVLNQAKAIAFSPAFSARSGTRAGLAGIDFQFRSPHSFRFESWFGAVVALRFSHPGLQLLCQQVSLLTARLRYSLRGTGERTRTCSQSIQVIDESSASHVLRFGMGCG